MTNTDGTDWMRISEIPTNETVTFITSHVRPGDRILEVGAGRGEVAQRIRAVGHSVVAIDSDANAVEEARREEIDVVHADFLAFRADPFDAIVFTRSLHHLSPLMEVLERARALLRCAGTILIEDFAFEKMNQITADWFHSELRALLNDGVANMQLNGFGAELVAAGGDLATWKNHHAGKHRIHTADTITAAVERVFHITMRSDAPYLYRYIASMLPDDESGFRILQDVLSREKSMLERGGIQAIGRRLVSVCKSLTDNC